MSNAIRQPIFHHIHQNAQAKGIEIDFVNGYYDHAHCLLKLPANISLADVVQLIKGESSHWINKQELTSAKFEWQNDYYAESVSIKDVEGVRNYIKNQEHHHRDTAFEKEIEQMEYYKE